jgi:parallel beta-helix repeat protein
MLSILEPLEGRTMMSGSVLLTQIPIVNRITSQTFTVTTTADNNSNSNPTVGSLRWAIEKVDQDSSTFDYINFAIGSGRQTIAPKLALPTITREVSLDATTQPGYAGSPLIEIDGRNVAPGSVGLEITGSYSTIKGLSVDNFATGIEVLSATGDVIQSNLIGSEASGYNSTVGTGIVVQSSSGITVEGNTVDSPDDDGIDVNSSSSCTIGGIYSWDANTINNAQEENGIALKQWSSSNNVTGNNITGAAFGVWIDNSSEYNTVGGNYISQSVSGGIESQGAYNTIGGSQTARNIISGVGYGNGIIIGNIYNNVVDNTVDGARTGIQLTTTYGTYANHSTVTGNYVYGNSGYGIDVQTSYNTIGTAQSGNAISGNGSYAIYVESGADFNVLHGNSTPGSGIAIAFGSVGDVWP